MLALPCVFDENAAALAPDVSFFNEKVIRPFNAGGRAVVSERVVDGLDCSDGCGFIEVEPSIGLSLDLN